MEQIEHDRRNGKVYGVKIPSELAEIIDDIAKREFQTKSAILKRLILLGLKQEGYLK